MSAATVEWIEGGVASAAGGAALGMVLTRGAVTAETGQVVWFLAMLLASIVAADANGKIGLTFVSFLPFFGMLLVVLAWTGNASIAVAVARVVIFRHVAIPLAAFTQREMTFRYGLFFLFVMAATLPACMAIALLTRQFWGVIQWSAALELEGRWFRRSRMMITRIWRLAACLAAMALLTYN